MQSLCPITKIFLIFFLSITMWGCSTGNSNSPQLDANGKHPSGWVELHRNEFRKNSEQCTTCHGSFSNAAKSGGISGVSCFTATRGSQSCHPNGPSGHPLNWEAAAQHGRAGAMAVPSAKSGFAYCSGCHGSLYSNAATRSCFACHTNAPHPNKPWHGTTVSGTNHIFTDPGNAAECAKCHTGGNNLSVQFQLASYATGTPGCFNATLCHGQNITHASGWDAGTQHGAAAKAAVSGSTGFGYCQQCHGTDYRGSATVTDCFFCHDLTPHAPRPWVGTWTHTNTDQSNARFCAQCHRNGANLVAIPSPPVQPASTPDGCFNNTLCHADINPPHIASATYLLASNHGPDAKANLASCQPCHGNPSSGNNPRFNVAKNNLTPNGCENCHLANTAHPTPWLPGRTGTPSPNTTSHATAGSIATACAICHGSALQGGSGPSCMSASIGNSRCHASSPATNPTGCISCHGKPPTGSAFPNRDNAHTEHHPFFIPAEASCLACHSGGGVNFTTQIGAATHSNAAGTVTVSVTATYKAKPAGNPTFTAGKTCTNVSCHGGQTTPAWNETNSANLINVNTECTKCHESGTNQFNSYFSGKHGDHTGAVACTTCHDTTKLAAGHFSNLATPTFELHPRNTLTFINPDNGATLTPTYNSGTRTYTCNFTCHGESHDNETWTGSP